MVEVSSFIESMQIGHVSFSSLTGSGGNGKLGAGAGFRFFCKQNENIF
jgi:hypothetical protein